PDCVALRGSPSRAGSRAHSCLNAGTRMEADGAAADLHALARTHQPTVSVRRCRACVEGTPRHAAQLTRSTAVLRDVADEAREGARHSVAYGATRAARL